MSQYFLPETIDTYHEQVLSPELTREVDGIMRSGPLAQGGSIAKFIFTAMHTVIYLGTTPTPEYVFKYFSNNVYRATQHFHNSTCNQIILCSFTSDIINSMTCVHNELGEDKLHMGLTAALQVKRKMLKVYHNPQNNSYLIATSAGRSSALMMKIIALIPGILNLNTTDEAKNILVQLTKQVAEPCVLDTTALENYIKDKLGEVIQRKQHESFVKFLSQANQRELNLSKKAKEDLEKAMTALMETYANNAVRLQTLNRNIFAMELQNKDIDYESQVKDVFDTVHNLLKDGQLFELYFRNEGVLFIKFLTPLRYWDTDFVTTRFNKDNITGDDRVLYSMCFDKAKFKIYTQSAIELDLVNKRVSCARAYDRASTTNISQPHIMHYNCFGANQRLIIDAIAEGNLILALTQTIVSAQNINLMDSTVWNHFRRDLVGTTTTKIACFKDVEHETYCTFDKVKEEYMKENSYEAD